MFQYECVKCGKEIVDRTGSIYVDPGQANARRIQQAEVAMSEPMALDMSQLAAQQARQVPHAIWRPYHDKCWGGTFSYEIEVHRLRTFEQFASWTAHLWGKKWFPFTDWDTFTRTYLKPADA